MHVAKDKRGKLDPKTRPLILMGYGDDELWNLAERKVIQSHDIVFMEEKTIADWELEKKTSTFESTDGGRLDGLRIHPVGSRMPVEDHSGPAGFKQETGSTKGELGVETGQVSQSDSDEEPTEESVVENQRRRYPLRERRPP